MTDDCRLPVGYARATVLLRTLLGPPPPSAGVPMALENCSLSNEIGAILKSEIEFKKALKIVKKEENLARQYGPMVPRVDDLERAIEECAARLEGK